MKFLFRLWLANRVGKALKALFIGAYGDSLKKTGTPEQIEKFNEYIDEMHRREMWKAERKFTTKIARGDKGLFDALENFANKDTTND